MAGRYAAYRRADDTISPEVVDRLMIGVCAAVWLIWLGASVVAVVALVDLGRGFRNGAHTSAAHNSVAHNSHTNWVLYSIIIVSAVVIAGAIPVLVRARRLSEVEPAAPTAPRGSAAGNPRIDRLVQPGVPSAAPGAAPVAAPGLSWSGADVDRVWLRSALSLAGTMGVALIGAAVATYLMAVGRDHPAWIVYGLAGAVVAAMPAIEWVHVRRLRALAA